MKKTTKIIIVCIISLIVIAAVGFFIIRQNEAKKEPLLTNLQITEYRNSEALAAVINELEKRGIKPATIFIGKDVAKSNCSLVKNLEQKGYEIAAFGYALDENGEFVQLANLSPEEQEKNIKDTKDAIENCLGHSINGFRAQRFSQNQDTLEIVKNLGFKWNGSFIVNRHPEASCRPYYSNNYGFYVVSIEGVGTSGYVLCDTAMGSSNKTAQEWRKTIQEYFLCHQNEGTPFITEFHPYFLVDSSDWWGEFTSLLDWFQKQKINYLTTQQLINHYSCSVCGE